MAERILTAVRVRPLSPKEKETATSEKENSNIEIVRVKDEKSIVVVDFSCNLREVSDINNEINFSYDLCFDKVATNHEIYCRVGLPLVRSCLEGFNCSIIAYGASGSGKTFTMLGGGVESCDGIAQLICSELFTGSHSMESKCTTKVSFVEIYNEKVYDLLSTSQCKAKRVRESPESGVFVEDLILADVSNLTDIEACLDAGFSRRSVASTIANQGSSRSHAIFNIYVEKINTSNFVTTSGKITLVDLAGSERSTSNGFSKERFREGTHINKSLSTLGDVIKALSNSHKNSGKVVTQEKIFIPYRNSVLTWMLKDSLGGSSKGAVLATVCPCASSYTETLNTLRYVERITKIVNHTFVSSKFDPLLRIAELEREVLDLRMRFRDPVLVPTIGEIVEKYDRDSSDFTIEKYDVPDLWKLSVFDEVDRLFVENEGLLLELNDRDIELFNLRNQLSSERIQYQSDFNILLQIQVKRLSEVSEELFQAKEEIAVLKEQQRQCHDLSLAHESPFNSEKNEMIFDDVERLNFVEDECLKAVCTTILNSSDEYSGNNSMKECHEEVLHR